MATSTLHTRNVGLSAARPLGGTDAGLAEHRTDAPPPAARAIAASFEIGACRLRIECVDDVVPRHVATRAGSRMRLVYAPGEVAHFELDGHRYAVVHEQQGHEETGPEGEGRAADSDCRALLTNRELQIVQLISMGCLTKQVSDRLHISEFTVRSYLKTIYCKLGVRSRGALVFRYAQSFKRREET